MTISDPDVSSDVVNMDVRDAAAQPRTAPDKSAPRRICDSRASAHSSIESACRCVDHATFISSSADARAYARTAAGQQARSPGTARLEPRLDPAPPPRPSTPPPGPSTAAPILVRDPHTRARDRESLPARAQRWARRSGPTPCATPSSSISLTRRPWTSHSAALTCRTSVPAALTRWSRSSGRKSDATYSQARGVSTGCDGSVRVPSPRTHRSQEGASSNGCGSALSGRVSDPHQARVSLPAQPVANVLRDKADMIVVGGSLWRPTWSDRARRLGRSC
jgi:hypothetical protein